jgi:Zn-dependent peptidase ImmA (M78 family)
MRTDLVERVMNDLKGVVPYKENIIWKDCNTTCVLGTYTRKENTIHITTYLEDDQEILNVMAHELIHAAGVHNHRKEFKEYAEKINQLGLGYAVTTKYKGNDKLFAERCKEVKAKQKSRNKEKKQYLVYCPYCGWHRIYNIQRKHINRYGCPECRIVGKLKQVNYERGKTSMKLILH